MEKGFVHSWSSRLAQSQLFRKGRLIQPCLRGLHKASCAKKSRGLGTAIVIMLFFCAARRLVESLMQACALSVDVDSIFLQLPFLSSQHLVEN